MMVLLIALAAQSAVSSADPIPPALPKAEKKLCRRLESTGSIMAKQTCHTRAEWTAIDQANSAQMDQYRDRRLRGSQTGVER